MFNRLPVFPSSRLPVFPSSRLPVFPSNRLLIATAVSLIVLSNAQSVSAQEITEDGEKVTLQNGVLAYQPKGTYKPGQNQVLEKVEQRLYEDINNNGTWTLVYAYTTMATTPVVNGTGNWIYPSGQHSPMVAGRKYRSEAKLTTRNRLNNALGGVEQHRDFTY